MTAEERFLLIEYLGMIGELDESSASPATVDEQFEDWYRLRASGVPGERFYKSHLAAAVLVQLLTTKLHGDDHGEASPRPSQAAA